MSEDAEYDYAAEDEKVGYRKPPKATRFKKGRSGNPRGRPKGSGTRSAIEKVLSRTIPMTVDGKRQRVPLTEALVTQLAQRALQGDIAATREVLKIANQAAQARAEEEPKDGGMTVIIRHFTSPEGLSGALEALGAIVEAKESGQLKMQPWVGAAALAQGISLSEAHRNLVAAFTLKPGEVIVERNRK